MKASRLAWMVSTVLFVSGLSLSGSASQPPSKSEQKRRELLDKVGLQKAPDGPPEEQTDEAPRLETKPEPRAPQTSPTGQVTDSTKPSSSPPESSAARRQLSYHRDVHAVLVQKCKSCHSESGSARNTGYVITSDVEADYQRALVFVDRAQPTGSRLVTKAIGLQHGGGASLKNGSSAHTMLVDWIRDGARLGSKRNAKPPTPTPTPSPSAGPAVTVSPSGQSSVRPPKDSARRPQVARPAVRPAARPAAPPSASPSPKETIVSPAVDDSDRTAGTVSNSVPAPAARGYAPAVHDILARSCGGCHAQGASASNTRYVISYDVDIDYATTLRFVDRAEPTASELLSKARGDRHGGGPTWTSESNEHSAVLEWITAGAPKSGASVAAPVDVTSAAPTANVPPSSTASGATTARPHDHTGVALPLDMRLNGKFDLSYERAGYENNPFAAGRHRLQSYHHFLVLSRNVREDPFGVNVEVLTQQFYEFTFRVRSPGSAYSVLLRAGKLVIPFGAEPTYHHSYGGRSGFDQQILPAIWARHGFAARFDVRLGDATLSNDLYTVHGYGITTSDQVIDLQRDFSPIDDVQFGFGDRLGASFGPLRVWYSVYGNSLGLDRRLFMQALDVQVSRPSQLPVLRDLAAGVGLLRADVSGGPSGRPPGSDYYHFGSYWSLRYYPVSPVYVEYRNGLRTSDNHRGVYFDPTRIDELDSSSHNVTVAARYRGFYARYQLFWNLEKANEQRDDFMRLTVGYEF